jgi:AraC family transcriptional regulator of adaptative response/methylated-DNA-[protein]-cysteine methyltransferase
MGIGTAKPAMVEDPGSAFALDEDRWQAVVARDARADGAFYYSVRTTGVYCRPSCGARQARRENVAFHATREDAEHAGFRPCLRCRPSGTSLSAEHAAIVAAACRTIELAETPPALAELAEAAGLSPFHFHRLFKASTGVTPKAYAVAARNRRMRGALAASRSVTEAIYDAGFNSSGRFYADAPGVLGMTPTRYRAGGAGETLRFAVGQTSLGPILVAATDKGIAAIEFGDDPEGLVKDLQDRFPAARLIGADAAFEGWVARAVGLVEFPSQPFDLPLDVRGTAFQQRVWQALRAIPSGSTASYSDIAQRLGMPKSVRAVAGACAANRVAIAIPCHRVVRNDGALSGYRWGVERKQALLDREAAE